MTAILLSVRPVYAQALLAGTKTAEVRRRFPEQPSGTEMFVYSSTPDRAVIGTVTLDAIDRPNAGDVWASYRDLIEIDEAPLNDYLTEVEEAAILRVSGPVRWIRPVPLSELRRELHLEPPQSFRYLSDDQGRAIRCLAKLHPVPRTSPPGTQLVFG